jgi:trans-aconitate 2-methyltransferase
VSRPREWDAETYERVSAPQEAWGRDVLDRLDLRGDERVLDAGCGTGRVTALLLERLPRGEVVAVDGSEAMVAAARERLGGRAEVFRSDLLELSLEKRVDAILSTATFHWIADHDRLFARLLDVLEPGGRLAAQCGGAGNAQAVVEAIGRVDRPALRGWDGPWNFPTPADTAARLRRLGWVDVWTWPHVELVHPEDPPAFVRTAILGSHLERLPEDERDGFVDAVMAELPTPAEIRYVRLNILSRRAPR